MDKNRPDTKMFVFVQITKKENWDGLRTKLATVWGLGQICDENGKAVTDKDNFEEIDTVGKRYLYLPAGKGKE